MIISFLTILLGSIALQSCKKEEPMTAEVKYSTTISSLMNNYCLTCHSGAAPSADLNLDNYTEIKAIGESGKLIDRINDSNSPMPPSGLMPEEKRQQIEDWIANGYQE